MSSLRAFLAPSVAGLAALPGFKKHHPSFHEETGKSQQTIYFNTFPCQSQSENYQRRFAPGAEGACKAGFPGREIEFGNGKIACGSTLGKVFRFPLFEFHGRWNSPAPGANPPKHVPRRFFPQEHVVIVDQQWQV
ncbi:MAG: hypothetical protein V3S64_02600, partial [bacterium]